jgi:predicted nucleic-acid-binding Zn-ribbon protein
MDAKELRRLRDMVVTAEAGAKAVACYHCGADRFRWQKVALSSRASSHFHTEILDDGAIALDCVECGCLLEFREDRIELTRAPSSMRRR